MTITANRTMSDAPLADWELELLEGSTVTASSSNILRMENRRRKLQRAAADLSQEIDTQLVRAVMQGEDPRQLIELFPDRRGYITAATNTRDALSRSYNTQIVRK